MSVNKIMAIGHLGANPVVRTLRSGRKVVPSGIGSSLLGSLADISERFLTRTSGIHRSRACYLGVPSQGRSQRRIFAQAWFDEFRTSSQRTEEGHGPKHAQSPD
jgi:single-stranded DNA-binding protein